MIKSVRLQMAQLPFTRVMPCCNCGGKLGSTNPPVISLLFFCFAQAVCERAEAEPDQGEDAFGSASSELASGGDEGLRARRGRPLPAFGALHPGEARLGSEWRGDAKASCPAGGYTSEGRPSGAGREAASGSLAQGCARAAQRGNCAGAQRRDCARAAGAPHCARASQSGAS